MDEARLFVSHASADERTAKRIVARLEASGVACWIAPRDIPPESVYAEAITSAIRASSACVVIVSAAANDSEGVARELELASYYRKPFIPIRIDSASLAPGFDYYLLNMQWFDYSGEGEAALDRIASHLPAAPARAPAPARRTWRSPPVAWLAIALLSGAVGATLGWQLPQRDAASVISQAWGSGG